MNQFYITSFVIRFEEKIKNENNLGATCWWRYGMNLLEGAKSVWVNTALSHRDSTCNAHHTFSLSFHNMDPLRPILS